MSNVTTGYVGSIDNATLQNAYFRQVLFTGPHMQLVDGNSSSDCTDTM